MIPGYYFDHVGTQLPAIVVTLPWHILKKVIKSQMEISKTEKKKTKDKIHQRETNLGSDGFSSWKQAIFQLHGINTEVEETKMGSETSDCSMLV